MGFHDIGKVFNASEDAAELREVFHFYNETQVGNAPIDVHFDVSNVDAFIGEQV